MIYIFIYFSAGEKNNNNLSQLDYNLEDLPDSFLDISDWKSSDCSSGSREALGQQPIVAEWVCGSLIFYCNYY